MIALVVVDELRKNFYLNMDEEHDMRMDGNLHDLLDEKSRFLCWNSILSHDILLFLVRDEKMEVQLSWDNCCCSLPFDSDWYRYSS